MTAPSTVLCGFYGRGNLGDEALLAGMLQVLDQGAGRRTTVLTPRPGEVRRMHGVAASQWDGAARGRRSVASRDARLARLLLQHDQFILGGGDLLRDSPTQDVAQVWLRPLRMAIALRRRVAVVGVSVGELIRDDTRADVRRTLNSCTLVTVRDEASAAALADVGVRTRVHVLPDLALALAPLRPTPSTGRIVVCLRGLADRGSLERDESWARAQRELAKALRAFPRSPITFLPLRSAERGYRPVDDDYVAACEFVASHNLGRDVDIVRHVPDVPALVEHLAEASVVVGMRLHSLVLAVGLGRPVVGLSYDIKVANFMSEVGGGEWVEDLSTVTSPWLVDRLTAALRDPDPGYDPDRSAELRVHGARVRDLLRDWQAGRTSGPDQHTREGGDPWRR